MNRLDQNLQKITNYSCSIYAFLNMIRYDFGVSLKIDWILKTVIYMEKIGVLLPKGAYASIIYPALLKYVKWKTGFSINMKKTTIDKIKPDDGYILSYKGATRYYITASKDGELTRKELTFISEGKARGGHFHYYKRGIVLETLGGFDYKLSYDNLKYAYKRDLYYPACRTFTAGDEYTEKAQVRLLALVKRDKRFISYDKLKILYNIK